MTANLISENGDEKTREGFVELSVQQVYQVITASRLTPFTTVLADPDLPPLNSAAVFDTQVLWCVNRNARRTDTGDTGKKWNVTCTWSNNSSLFRRDTNGVPVTDPTQAAKTVAIQYLEYAEPIVNAEQKSCTIGGGPGVGTEIATPPWLKPTPTYKGAIRVSTGEVVYAEKTAYRQNITVSRIERSWDSSYEDYTNTINELEVVITESDSVGVQATYTYAPLTLRMKPITKQAVWQDAKMYYQVTYEMEHKADTWIHSEYDVSQKYRAKVDDDKPDGTKWTQAKIDERGVGTNLAYCLQSIETIDNNGESVPIGEPDKLNGYGTPMPWDRSDGVAYDKDADVYVNYDVYEIKDFTPLGL